jgi:hypothetical protein
MSESNKMSFWAWMIAGPVVVALMGAVVAYLVFAQGYVAHLIWKWHAVPFGLPAISWPTFAAAVVLKRVLFSWKPPGAEPKDERTSEEKTRDMFLYLAAPWLMLLLAWWLA